LPLASSNLMTQLPIAGKPLNATVSGYTTFFQTHLEP
jgi:hypothetical protein